MTPPEAMTCWNLVEAVTDYLEGAMGEPERALIDAHLAECDGCTDYLEQMRTTIRVTGRLTEEQISPEARDALRGVFRAWAAPA